MILNKVFSYSMGSLLCKRSKKIQFVVCLTCTASTLIFLNRRGKPAGYHQPPLEGGGWMERHGNRGRSLGIPKDFPVHISDSAAIANNTAGLAAISQAGERQGHGG